MLSICLRWPRMLQDLHLWKLVVIVTIAEHNDWGHLIFFNPQSMCMQSTFPGGVWCLLPSKPFPSLSIITTSELYWKQNPYTRTCSTLSYHSGLLLLPFVLHMFQFIFWGLHFNSIKYLNFQKKIKIHPDFICASNKRIISVCEMNGLS